MPNTMWCRVVLRQAQHNLHFLAHLHQQFKFFNGHRQALDRPRPPFPLAVGHHHATAHRIGLPTQVGAERVFVITRETPHGLFQQHCQGNGVFPDGQMVVAGHDSERAKEPKTVRREPAARSCYSS